MVVIPPLRRATPAAVRATYLDAVRGLAVLACISAGMGVAQVARHFPDDATWQVLARQTQPAAWVGCTGWDMIQPAFFFLVGVSLTYSAGRRWAQRRSLLRMLPRAVLRAVVLVALGILVASEGAEQTRWTFVNPLAQIGLGYLFAFFLWRCHAVVQAAAAALILGGWWASFAFTPPPPEGFDFAAVGAEAGPLPGAAAAWTKNANPATYADQRFLNLFPRTERFTHDPQGRTTLAFLPGVATMLLGLLAGSLFRSTSPWWSKLLWPILGGGLLLGAGLALHEYHLCPIVPRLGSPSWVLYSGGWLLWALTASYLLVNLLRARWLVWPLAVPGSNPLPLYLLAMLAAPWFERTLATHFGPAYANSFGAPFAPLVRAAAVFLLLWLLALWMHRRRAYLRL